MIDEIIVNDKDELCFYFDNFEFILFGDNNYLLCDEGYFVVEGLQSFHQLENGWSIRNEERDEFILTDEQFELVKEIILKHL